jgi:hypothetical protein
MRPYLLPFLGFLLAVGLIHDRLDRVEDGWSRALREAVRTDGGRPVAYLPAASPTALRATR